MDITRHLTLVGTLKRNRATVSESGAFPESYATVKAGVACRISQASRSRAVIGLQEVADLNPIIQFEPDEAVHHLDRIEITGGVPAQLIGTTWDLYSPVVPSVPVYLSATARRVLTASG